MMEIKEYFGSGSQDHWLKQIGRSEWGAGQFLYEQLRDGRLKELLGESARIFLLTEGEELISFCSYAEQDDIPAPGLSPWVGFVYTFPEHRGKRCMGKLLEHACAVAKAEGHEYIYISTREEGLYEKYGCTFWKTMKDVHGEESRVFRMRIRRME